MEDTKLGDLIRKYRKSAGLSQFELELDIETSPGRISKIESGKINPDKETIIKIAKTLKLDTYEISALFGISIPNVKSLFYEVNKILIKDDCEEIINITVNDLIFKLGFLASALFLVNEHKIYMSGLTSSQISRRALAELKHPLDQLFIPINHVTNLTAVSIRECIATTTHFTREYITPLVDTYTADKIQEVTGDKSVLIIPMIVNGNTIGAIAYVKKIVSDFEKEKDLLKIVTNQVGISLYKAINLSPKTKTNNSNPVS